MKYIKTKDGRIIDFKFSKKEYEERYPDSKFSYDRWFELASEDFDILKQADTIEELCDEFVEVSGFLPFISEVRFEHWDKQTKKILIKQNTEVYGAVWTDKGLIYVAKMNEKGELELI